MEFTVSHLVAMCVSVSSLIYFTIFFHFVLEHCQTKLNCIYTQTPIRIGELLHICSQLGRCTSAR